MTRRPLLALTAATAALALCAAPGTAAAASTAAGRGTSSLSVLSLTVAGHTLSLADLSLVSDTIASPRVSSVSLTPVTVDGTAYGVPFGSNALGLYYNAEVLKRAGVDPATITDWASLDAAIGKVVGSGSKGITFSGITGPSGPNAPSGLLWLRHLDSANTVVL